MAYQELREVNEKLDPLRTQMYRAQQNLGASHENSSVGETQRWRSVVTELEEKMRPLLERETTLEAEIQEMEARVHRER